jgi:phage terminase large subunit GpA-like protein
MLITQKTTAVPAFPGVSGRYQGRPSRALRTRMRTPEKLSIAAWARKHRRVTEIDSTPGAWDESKLPHTVEIMEAISQPYVRAAYLCMPERGGKTQILINAMAHKVDQGSQSGNIFWLMPTEAEAKKAMAERIIPVLKATDDLGRPGRLARYLSRYDDDTKRGTIRFSHGIRLFPAWSNSPASMASYFGALNIADEIDKFEISTKEGTDALTLLEKRGRDDLTRSKNIYASTPGRQRKIYTLATEDAQQVKRYHLRCPHCAELINPGEQHLDLAPGATVKDIEQGGCELACPACGGMLDEDLREQAFRHGGWVTTKGAELKRPETIGRHMSAFVLPMVPLKEIAVAYLRAQGTSLPDKIAFANGYQVRDYDYTEVEKFDVTAVAARRENYGSQVPAEAGYITAGVDVQGDRLEVEVIAWGLGYENWGLDYRQLFGDTSLPYVWEELDRYLATTWTHSTGTKLRIGCTVIDSGYRADHVYQYTHGKRRRGIIAGKGSSTRNHPLVRGPNNLRHGRLRVPLVHVGGDQGKELLYSHLAIDQVGPGYCHYPEHYPDNYFRMLAAEEYQVTQKGGRSIGEWVKVADRNESIDLRVYNYAALQVGAPNLEKLIQDLNEARETASIKKDAEHKNLRHRPVGRPSWRS